jgi:hypothetical protein
MFKLIDSRYWAISFKFFKYALKAFKVHFDLVIFDFVSYSALESSSLPGRTNGLDGPSNCYYEFYRPLLDAVLTF